MNDLPPLPPLGTFGPDVCTLMRPYIAVWQDLSPEQMKIVSAHMQGCKACARNYQLVGHATQLVANLDKSSPSPRVDQAVLAAIAARNRGTNGHGTRPSLSLILPKQPQPRRASLRLVGLVATIAALLLVIFSLLLGSSSVMHPQTAFALPTNLSWNAYVLYHSQTKVSSNGDNYHISTYHNLAANRTNVETMMDGKLDVMVVKDASQALGLDKVRHIAQWGAESWGVESWGVSESTFDLAKLRRDLQAKRATYLGEDDFRGWDVYRIRTSSGLVLLLDMQYRPVNVLKDASGPGTGVPMFDIIQLLQASQVPDSTWEMSVPQGFTLGKLPAKPWV